MPKKLFALLKKKTLRSLRLRRKTTFLVLLLLAITAIIVVLLKNRPTVEVELPLSVPATTCTPKDAPTPQNIPEIKIPNRLSFYTASPSISSIKDLNPILQKLNLPSSPLRTPQGEYHWYLWKNKTRSLKVDQNYQTLEYFPLETQDSDQENAASFSKETEVLTYAWNFLADNNFLKFSPIEETTGKILLLQKEDVHYSHTNSFTKANTFLVSFSVNLNGHPILSNFTQQGITSVLIDKTGKVLNAKALLIKLTKNSTVKLKKEKAVQEELLDQKGLILTNYLINRSRDCPTKVILNEGSIAYFINHKVSNQAVPVAIFSGSAVVRNQPIPAKILLDLQDRTVPVEEEQKRYLRSFLLSYPSLGSFAINYNEESKTFVVLPINWRKDLEEIRIEAMQWFKDNDLDPFLLGISWQHFP
ncbi:hypothetical protein B5M47_00190 [candidate division CPR3 bacterium 4484_211]|uniref:Uncharacterized protein n=1 Tax=candidate division CPR3 bacterium 4484_211 TaxID=1968527 RepID=A0A1W9P020_UNCC3|nr:MAG: hypothetical protein B5M47_00190 [candidate division CPR3 bacterium 4484_211]